MKLIPASKWEFVTTKETPQWAIDAGVLPPGYHLFLSFEEKFLTIWVSGEDYIGFINEVLFGSEPGTVSGKAKLAKELQRACYN